MGIWITCLTLFARIASIVLIASIAGTTGTQLIPLGRSFMIPSIGTSTTLKPSSLADTMSGVLTCIELRNVP